MAVKYTEVKYLWISICTFSPGSSPIFTALFLVFSLPFPVSHQGTAGRRTCQGKGYSFGKSRKIDDTGLISVFIVWTSPARNGDSEMVFCTAEGDSHHRRISGHPDQRGR